MTIEQELYQMILLIAGIANLVMAFVLLHNNSWYRAYDVYHRACVFTAVVMTAFGLGFFMHAYFEWRTSWPVGASALSTSYFHLGGVFFGWSQTCLLSPRYPSKKEVVRDLSILTVGLIAYWTTAASASLLLFQLSQLIFFTHCGYIAYFFYRTYYRVRRNLKQLKADDTAPYWWTPENKFIVLSSHHSFAISCHLIILFGLGGVVVTALFPHDVTPFTILLGLGIMVFVHIFYSLMNYGSVIESGTYATEDTDQSSIT
jgi:hypothetical protein